MSFSEQKIMDILSEKLVNLHCCKNDRKMDRHKKKYHLLDSPITYNDGKTKNPYDIPVITLICTYCGHISHYSKKILMKNKNEGF